MPQPMLDAFDFLPGIAFVPMPVEGLGHKAELDDEVAGQVLRLGLAPFLSPQAHQGCFIAAHDDPGIRAADKRPALDKFAKLHCSRKHLRTRDSWKLLNYLRYHISYQHFFLAHML